MKRLGLLIALVLLAWPLPGRQSGAILAGEVLRTDTRAPVQGAIVFLRDPSVVQTPAVNLEPFGSLPQATTDSNGRFSLQNVPAGRYRLFAKANGYATRESRQVLGGFAGVPLEVASGEVVRDLSVGLIPNGSVSGLIRDPRTRDPLGGIPVFLTSPSYDTAGGRRFRIVGKTTTDGAGRYSFSDVVTGSYYLAAGIEGLSTALNGRKKNEFAVTYYPGLSDIAAATRVDVRPAQETAGLVFDLVEGESRRLTGRIVDVTTGRPPIAATLMLLYQSLVGDPDITPLVTTAAYDEKSGTFSFSDLEPREYTLSVMPGVVGPRELIGQTQLDGSSPLIDQSAAKPVVTVVDLRRSDADNLTIRVPSGKASVSGTVRLEGGAFDPSRVQFVLRALTIGDQSWTVRPKPDGSFEVNNVKAADYRLILPNPPQGAYVKQALFNGVDVVGSPIRILDGTEGKLDIVLNSNGGRAQIVVRDERGILMPGIFTGLIPSTTERLDLYRGEFTGSLGELEFLGISPGTYRVLASEAGYPLAYFDPTFVERVRQYGTVVTVPEGARVQVDLKINRH